MSSVKLYFYEHIQNCYIAHDISNFVLPLKLLPLEDDIAGMVL